ncbi:MAG TPA: hypothetical protein VF765_26020 [Polyangiaceae bacterium]
MSSGLARTLLGPVTLACTVVTCGGTVDVTPDVGTRPEAGASGSSGGDDAPGSSVLQEAGGGSASTDAAAGDVAASDGATCVDIDVSTFDRSCQNDSDCINVSAGTICSGYNCLCGGAAINASEQGRYNAALASVEAGPGPYCQCPYFGRPRCLQAQCVYCPSSIGPMPAPPGCPDGG